MLHFELVTPEKLVRSEDVYIGNVVPGTEGDFGVLEGHAPIMSTVRDGCAVDLSQREGRARAAADPGRGFAEVNGKRPYRAGRTRRLIRLSYRKL